MAAEISYERFAGEHVTTEMLDAAAKLFSAHYGVWGSLAAERVVSQLFSVMLLRFISDH